MVMAMALKKAFLEINCTMLDLPHVIQGMTKIGGVGFVGGDMFEWVPPASVTMLKVCALVLFLLCFLMGLLIISSNCT